MGVELNLDAFHAAPEDLDHVDTHSNDDDTHNNRIHDHVSEMDPFDLLRAPKRLVAFITVICCFVAIIIAA